MAFNYLNQNPYVTTLRYCVLICEYTERIYMEEVYDFHIMYYMFTANRASQALKYSFNFLSLHCENFFH